MKRMLPKTAWLAASLVGPMSVHAATEDTANPLAVKLKAAEHGNDLVQAEQFSQNDETDQPVGNKQAPPSSDTVLPAVIVQDQAIDSLTSKSTEDLKRTLQQTVGSVGFVDSHDYEDTYAFNLRDVLKNVPGVFVQDRYGQELRLSIRGSGIARSYHTRGLEILQDGIPTNFADGSGDYYQIDPLALQAAEVYKGGNGLAYGASMLGGAINFITPTAYTADAPEIIGLEAGSYGNKRVSGQLSRVLGPLDFIATLSATWADGFRRHDRGQYQQFNSNIGYRLSPTVETRFYLGAYFVDQRLPGTLTLSDALNHPERASASALAGDQARNTRTERLANRTTVQLDSGELQFDTWAIHKTLDHPIFQALDQDGWTYGVAPRYLGHFDIDGMHDELITGARYFGGRNQADQYVNVNGDHGAKTLDSTQAATNYDAYLENRLFFMSTVALMAGVKALRSVREYTDHGGLPTNPDSKSDRKTYNGINPKLGLMWQPDANTQAYVDVTRSQDVPDFSDLNQTFGQSTRFTPLSSQHAWTLEVGTRGSRDRYSWDVTAYRSFVRDQLLQYTTDPDIPASTFNADKTVLQGIEAGASVDLLRNVTGPDSGDKITLSGLWNLSDFHFDDDAQYGDNRIAGVPRNLLRAVLGYSRPNGFHVATTMDWVPQGVWADDANTLRVPGYTLIGLEAGLDLHNGVSLFVDLRNLMDKRYISDISTVADARTANTAIFYPGTERSIYAGVRYGF